MQKMKFLIVLASLLSMNAFSQNLPQVSSGTIQRIADFPSRYVNTRHVDVWLPPHYDLSKKYAVLYMHDGQMLYDSSSTWNKTSWNVDDVAALLLKADKVRPFIVVGIWNGEKSRHPDYFPQKPFELLTKEEKNFVTGQLQNSGRTIEIFQPQSDNYLKFIVTELKPYIDEYYPTRKGRKDTFIAGSSMGGLISLYAICEYPEVFGGAACLSTHWPGIFTMDNNPVPGAFVNYLQNNLPDSKNHKIYFDYGDQTLDAMYPPLQKQVDEVMMAKGFKDKNWITRYFPGENHSEIAWNKRLDIPLLFLLKK
jgi:predicted alpha/beta superfamily hydrolase